jgi:hypothetical protein
VLFTEKEEPGSEKIGGGADDPGGSIAERGTLGWWKLQLKPVQCLDRAAAVAAGWHCGGEAHGGRGEGTDTAGHAAGRTASTAIILLLQAQSIFSTAGRIRRAKSGGGVGSPAPSNSPRASAANNEVQSSDTPKSAPSHATTQAPCMPSCELPMVRYRSALLQPAPMLPLSQRGRRKARIRHPTSRCATWRILHRAHKDGPIFHVPKTPNHVAIDMAPIWRSWLEPTVRKQSPPRLPLTTAAALIGNDAVHEVRIKITCPLADDGCRSAPTQGQIKIWWPIDCIRVLYRWGA